MSSSIYVCFCAFVLGVTAVERIERLPEIVTPVHYRLALLPLIESNTRLCGHVWIDVIARMTTSIIMLHASADITVLRALVTRANSTRSSAGTDELVGDARMVEDYCFRSTFEIDETTDDILLDVAQDGQRETLTIVLSEPLIKGANYRIGILYQGSVYENTNHGLFRSLYYPNETDCCHRTIGATQLEATHARKLFPCMDEPDRKATFQLMVGHASSITALSNMPTTWTVPMLSVDNWRWDVYETTPVMSTYLVAVVLTEFDHVETIHKSIDGRDIQIRLWTQRAKLHQLQFATHLVPRVLAKMETYLRVPYSLPKLDLVAVPGFDNGKAMENWGLVIHSEENLLVDSESELWDVELVAVTIIHELAHQWLGNLVTTRWWDDIWVTEGLTTLFEDIVLKAVAPELEGEIILVVFLQEVMKGDFVVGSNYLSAPISAYAHVDEKFDTITYAKGAAIMRMIRSFIGEEAFRSAVQRYISLNKFGSANSSDIWTLFNQEARRAHTISGRMSIARAMKTWTHQPGYPVVHARRTDHGYVHLSQRPFMHENNKTRAPSSASWFIPVTSTDAESIAFGTDALLSSVTWLSPRKPSTEIIGPKKRDSWFIVNPQSSGYYRVNYDRANWQLLADQLQKNFTVIPFLTRAQLVDDAFSLAHARVIPYEVPMKLVKYLDSTGEEGFIRKLVKSHVEQIESMDGNDLHDRSDEMVDEIMSCVTRENSYNTLARTGRSVTSTLVNGNCEAGEQSCSNEALRLYRKLVNNTLTSNEQELMNAHFDSVWCAAIRDGGKNEWAFAWKSAKVAGRESLRRKMLKAMACSTDPAHNKQLVSRLFDPNVNQSPKETTEILLRLAENARARELALNFLLANWDLLVKHFKSTTRVGHLLREVVKHSFSSEDLYKVRTFLAQRSGELDERTASQVVAAIEINLRWLQDGAEVSSSHGGATSTATIGT